MAHEWGSLPKTKKALLALEKSELHKDFSLVNGEIYRSNREYGFVGLQILNKEVFAACKKKKFSLFKEYVFTQLQKNEKLQDFYGFAINGRVTHVGNKKQHEEVVKVFENGEL